MSNVDPWSEAPTDFASVSAEQRRAWAQMSADERLRWLEDALTFAAQAGALAADRRRRAEEAEAWGDDSDVR